MRTPRLPPDILIVPTNNENVIEHMLHAILAKLPPTITPHVSFSFLHCCFALVTMIVLYVSYACPIGS